MGYTSLPPQVSGAGWFGVLRGLSRAAAGVALATGLSTCGPDASCLKSTGTIITERREVAPGLTTIYTFDNVDVRLVQDPQTYAEVRAGKNLIADIELTRKGNSLEISNSSSCNWLRSYDTPREVTLHLPNITDIFLRGHGNISTVGQFAQDTIFFHLIGAGNYDLHVKARQLYIDQYEVGDVTVRGQAIELNFLVGGGGRLFAQGIAAQRCYFTMTRHSDGNAYVRASDIVGGLLAGTGTLYYGGPPASTDITITGKGKAKAE
ncbi:GIN domain-containing protein [Hymenobacter sp. B1770]|uniref:GIN domain-containing protein n=1 Tax=Hymenobacter sp. B1770 TaxID=1718788 RepID=UPI003CEE8170